MERLALTRLRPHLLNSVNFGQYQSAYRTGHSTETALLEILDGVYTAADDKQISVLIGLDLSAAFDTVDHSLLTERLQAEFGVTDTALDWLRSYIADRVLFVKMGQHQSNTVPLDVGVSQRSVLGPRCCLLSTVTQWVTLSCSTVSSFISMLTTGLFGRLQAKGRYPIIIIITYFTYSCYMYNNYSFLLIIILCTVN